MAQTAIASFLVLVAYLNFTGWASAPFAVVLGVAYLALTAYALGGRFGGAPGQRTLERLAWGLIAWAALMASLGAAAFYLWHLSSGVVFTLLALVPWFGKNVPREATPAEHEHRLARLALGGAYLALVVATFVLVAGAATSEAIRTPWQVVPGAAWVAYALAAGCLLLLARYAHSPAWLVPFYFVSLSVLALVYPLGYGFDPFIHQASEKIIEAAGVLIPKPPYYVGQYALVLALRYASGQAVALIDSWLVPALAALTLPFILARALKALQVARPYLFTLALAPLALGLAAGFTYTTPQGLANLFALTTVLALASRGSGAPASAALAWLCALAALAVHPLTGLPLAGVVLLWWLRFEQPGVFGRWHQAAVALAAAGTALVVPLAFIVLSWLTPGAASVQFSPDILGNLGRLGGAMLAALPQLPHFSDVGDVVYLWGRPLTLVVLLLASLGWRRVRFKNGAWQLFAWLAALPTAGYLVLALGFRWPNLPPHEQNFYSLRLWNLALVCLTPLVLAGAHAALNWIAARLPSYLPWVVAGALVLTAGWYLSYPRFDRWHSDTAYNTTPADVAAVALIQNDAGTSPYVVLANQAVAAGAIRELGFAHYYNGNFFYPVPTGANPLYQVYLNATERGLPTKAVVREAAQETGVPRVYLVLNRYWADFLKLAPIAQREASARWQVADDRVQVYRYDF